MDNIEDILKALAADDARDAGSSSDSTQNSADGAQSGTDGAQGADEGGIFGGLDPETLIAIMSAFDALSKPSDNERFLMSLKPLLREENRAKIDTAVKLLKLLALLPLIKDSGLTKLL